KVLTAADFIELRDLRNILAVSAVFFILTALLARRILVDLLFGALILVEIVARVDVRRWRSDYGNILAPTPPLIVPAAAAQPPLLGYKQLLDFLGFSITDIGGWIVIVCGLVLTYCSVAEWRIARQKLP